MAFSIPLRISRRWRGLRVSVAAAAHHGLPTLAEAEEAALHLLHDATHPRKWWTRSVFWLAILAGLALSLSLAFQALMWMVPGYRMTVAREASTAIGHPVSVGKLALTWHWAQPMVEARRVTLYADDARTPLANAEKLRFGFEPLQLLRGRFVPAEVNVAGLALAIDIDSEGHAHLRGLPSTANPPSLAKVLQQLRRFERIKADEVSFSLRDVRVPTGNFALVLSHGDLRIDDNGMELRARLRAPGVIADELVLRAGLAGNLEKPETLGGQWTLEASNLATGAALLARVPALRQVRLLNASFKANGNWADLALGESNLNFEAAAAGIEVNAPLLPNTGSASLHRLAFALHYTPAADGGALQVRNLQLIGERGAWPTASAALRWQQNASGHEWTMNADFLRLDDLCPWLALLPIKAAAGETLPPSRPLWTTAVGDLQGLEARYASDADGSPKNYALHARMQGFGIGASKVLAGGPPGAHGLSGDLTATEAGGKLGVIGSNARVVLPRAFDLPVVFENISGSFAWQRAPEGWRVQAPDLAWRAEGTQGKGSLKLLLAAAHPPELDLDLRFSAADAARLKPWMPHNWGEGLKHWLNAAIVRARVPAAHLWIKGPMADFPFHKVPSGDWGLDLTVADARLEYQPEWPGADQLSAALRFRGNGLAIDVDHGLVSGVTATRARGSIADFAAAPLLLDINTAGEAAHYYELLRSSPLQTTLRGLLTQTDGEGPAQTDVHLEIPLHADSGHKLVASGVVRLADNRLRVVALDTPVEGITGTLRFGGTVGVAGEGISGRLYNTPIAADIASLAGVDTLIARFNTRFDEADPVTVRYVPAWLRPSLSGISNWKLALPLAGPRGGKITLTSNLLGASSRLPPPLAKTSGETLPLRIAIDSDDTTPLRLNLEAEGRLSLALRFGRERGELVARGVSMALGAASAGSAAEDGLRLVGSLERLNPKDWLALLGGIHGASLPFLGAQLSAQRLLVGGYETPPVSVAVAKSGEGSFNVTLSGAGGSGTASLNADSSLLTADLSRLALQAVADTVAATKPASESKPSTSEPVIDPAKLPALKLRIDALSIGNQPFGALTLATERGDGGQILNTCTLTGGVATVNASGNWRRRQGASEAATRFTLSSGNLAEVLLGLGFAPTISGKQVVITGDLSWAGSGEGGLNWAFARGKVDLSADSGTLSSVDPGNAGRVLGLLNLYALPRRLIFDFHDVIDKGLGYDRIEGGFDLADGVAKVRKLSIKGPSVKMEITGNVGLAKRDLDQTVTVTPNTTGLTLGAVLVGGATLAVAPAVGVLAVIANQVLDKPIGQATKFSYRLTGPWDNPQIRRSDGSTVTAVPPPPAKPQPVVEPPATDAAATSTPPATEPNQP